MAIFHQLHPDPIYCTADEWSGFQKTKPQWLVREMKRRKLIISTKNDDEKEYGSTAGKLIKKLNQPIILYLMTAQGCNFSCDYCPIPELSKKFGSTLLSSENAMMGIDLWLRHIRTVYSPDLNYYLIFYGGEPLLNKPVIKASLDYLEKKKNETKLPQKINVMIATNGSLIDDETIALCKKYEITVVVGLDGKEKENDSLRKDQKGKGTYRQTIKAVKKLIANGIRTCASVSITPNNINFIHNYSEFIKQLGIEKFGFNFLKGKYLQNLVGKDGVYDYYQKASLGVIKNSVESNDEFFEYQMEKKISAFKQKDYFPVDCTCYGNQLVIKPDGQVSNCPFYGIDFGQVKSIDRNFRIWKQPDMEEWRKRLPLFHEDYKEEESMALCGGGCAWSSNELKGSPTAVDDSSKIFTKKVFDEIIWSKLSSNGHA